MKWTLDELEEIIFKPNMEAHRSYIRILAESLSIILTPRLEEYIVNISLRNPRFFCWDDKFLFEDCWYFDYYLTSEIYLMKYHDPLAEEIIEYVANLIDNGNNNYAIEFYDKTIELSKNDFQSISSRIVGDANLFPDDYEDHSYKGTIILMFPYIFDLYNTSIQRSLKLEKLISIVQHSNLPQSD